MLSIAAMNPSSGGYYINLATEDYYLDGGEPPGEWWGRAATHFEVPDRIDGEAFGNVFRGLHPFTSAPVVRTAPDGGHHPGWDLTFSAPKTVSTLWSNSGSDVRHEIQAAQLAAVKAALAYLEDKAIICRRGHGGHFFERGAGLLAALFEHGTSRAQDPQLHTHALVMNIALRTDGTAGTLLGAELFRHKMAAGAVYRAELARQLQDRLAVRIRKTKDGFEIDHVPRSLVREFSKRAASIRAFLKQRRLRGAKAAAEAAILTRTRKGHASRAGLFERWRETGKAHGFDTARCFGHPQRDKPDAIESWKLVSDIADELTRHQSFFAEKDIVRLFADRATGSGLSAAEIREVIAQALAVSERIICLGQSRASTYYTTAQVLEREEGMLTRVEEMKRSNRHLVAERRLAKAERQTEREMKRRLSLEQQEALRHITAQPGAVKVVEGWAGTGKTTLLAAARRAWEQQGLQVFGACLAAKAARGLETEAGILSDTVERRLIELGLVPQPPRPKPSLRQQIAKIKKALSRKPKPSLHTRLAWKLEKLVKVLIDEPPPPKFVLGPKTVLVIDEASMVDTRRMALLVDAVACAGAKLVLVGDSKQLQAIEAGGAFRAIGELVGKVELQEIRRQTQAWARQAVFDLATGEPRRALDRYAAAGLLTVTADRNEARIALLNDWNKGGRQGLILAGTREDARLLNEAAQQLSFPPGYPHIRVDGKKFHVGDRVIIQRNHRRLKVANGDLGVVTAIIDYCISNVLYSVGGIEHASGRKSCRTRAATTPCDGAARRGVSTCGSGTSSGCGQTIGAPVACCA